MLGQVQWGPLSPDSPLHIRPLRMTFVMGGNSRAGSWQYIMRNTWLDEAQGGIKIAGRNINNLRYADDTTLLVETKELKSLLMKVKEESEKVA